MVDTRLPTVRELEDVYELDDGAEQDERDGDPVVETQLVRIFGPKSPPSRATAELHRDKVVDAHPVFISLLVRTHKVDEIFSRVFTSLNVEALVLKGFLQIFEMPARKISSLLIIGIKLLQLLLHLDRGFIPRLQRQGDG